MVDNSARHLGACLFGVNFKFSVSDSFCHTKCESGPVVKNSQYHAFVGKSFSLASSFLVRVGLWESSFIRGSSSVIYLW